MVGAVLFHGHHYPPKPIKPLPPIHSLSLSKTLLSLPKPKPKAPLPNPQVSLSNSPPVHPLDHLNNPIVSKPTTQHCINHYINLLNLSVRYTDTELAKAVHVSILKIEQDTHLSNALLTAYLKLGQIKNAHKVFETIPNPDVVSYTAMISGFAKSNREMDAIDLFFEMRGLDIEPNEYTFVALLTVCVRILNLDLGFQVHGLVMKLGYLDHVYVVNSLMGLYVKCGYLDLGMEVFDEMSQRDIASWNTLILGVVKEGLYERAFGLFRDMLRIDGFRVDHFTISALLTACTGGFGLRKGQELHAHALIIGMETHLSVNNALIGFYTKCGSVKDVVALFERMPVRDLFTWNEMITAYLEFGLVDLAEEVFDKMPRKDCVTYDALLSGYCRIGNGPEALELFCRMVEEGTELTAFTLTSVINACGLLMETKTSEQIHGFVLKFGVWSNECVEAALLDMCTRCGRMDDAEKMFNRRQLKQDSSIIWTSMICGYARNGQADKAISLFCQMQLEKGVGIDIIALTAVLGVCGTLGFHVFGEQIHCRALKSGFLSDMVVENALISMYSKCGYIGDGTMVFNIMPTRDVVSWNSLIAGHVLHRQGDEALAVWAKMEKAGLQPDNVTCALIISAYKHTNTNLVDCCQRFLLSMENTYHIEPTSEHYASLVGVLGYWGLLEEAEEVINKMPFKPEASVWRSLLDCCRIHSNTTVGKRAAKKILEVEPRDPSTYVLQANLYSASGRWHCYELVREEMRAKGLRKFPVRSWIIHQNEVHSFYARDKSHSQTKDIYSGVKILIMECLKAGYIPDTSFVLHEVEEHQKKDFLFYHSAKLAVTYGLLMTRPGKPVRIMKNILLCGDCHTFFKYTSVVTKREIHVRDASGFHCFLNGQCACKDHW